MEKINVFDVQVPDGRQIRCMSYNKVTYFDLDDICKLCFDSYDLHDVADTKVMSEVVGLNKGWKNGVNLGKRINQKFVEIPFSKLVEKISYKCKLVGIDFQVHEESYTSKVDHLAFEKLGKHDVYLGKRKKRGLFQSSIGKLINADINGTIGIGRKVFGDSYVSRIIGSGLAFNPVRVNIL